MGSAVAAASTRTCSTTSSSVAAPSTPPSVNAKPELVVASAWKPSASSTRAAPASHGFGMMNASPSCSARKRSPFSSCPGITRPPSFDATGPARTAERSPPRGRRRHALRSGRAALHAGARSDPGRLPADVAGGLRGGPARRHARGVRRARRRRAIRRPRARVRHRPGRGRGGARLHRHAGGARPRSRHRDPAVADRLGVRGRGRAAPTAGHRRREPRVAADRRAQRLCARGRDALRARQERPANGRGAALAPAERPRAAAVTDRPLARSAGVSATTAPPTPARAGEPLTADFDALYRATVDDLFAYVATLLRDRAAAEDVVAAAFERAYRRRGSYDARRGSRRQWLFGIARHAALDELRRRRRVASLVAEPETGDPRLDEAADPLRRATVRAALAGLDARDRELVALKFFGGLDNAEIAGVLGISPSNAGTRLHRAVRRLREACHAPS